MKPLAIAGSSAAAGAMLAYFLDKDLGHRRRAMARQRIAGRSHRLVRRGGRIAAHAGAEARGVAERAAHPKYAQAPPPDDTSLARKVETEIFRAADVPKGSILVNAERGVVYLRGTANGAEQIAELERQTRTIPGVRGVENRLSPR